MGGQIKKDVGFGNNEWDKQLWAAPVVEQQQEGGGSEDTKAPL